MTEQDIFNAVWDWFVVRGMPRSDGPTGCMYHRKDGARCAIGLFMTDDTYCKAWEGVDILTILYRSSKKAKRLRRKIGEHTGLLLELLAAHDNQPDRPMAEKLRHVALQFKLKVP